MGVIEDVTSPSFIILNEYKTKYFPIYHFDLYRLENSGLDSIKEELREYSKENILTFVEWADFGAGELPFDKMEAYTHQISQKHSHDYPHNSLQSYELSIFPAVQSKNRMQVQKVLLIVPLPFQKNLFLLHTKNICGNNP